MLSNFRLYYLHTLCIQNFTFSAYSTLYFVDRLLRSTKSNICLLYHFEIWLALVLAEFKEILRLIYFPITNNNIILCISKLRKKLSLLFVPVLVELPISWREERHRWYTSIKLVCLKRGEIIRSFIVHLHPTFDAANSKWKITRSSCTFHLF